MLRGFWTMLLQPGDKVPEGIRGIRTPTITFRVLRQLRNSVRIAVSRLLR